MIWRARWRNGALGGLLLLLLAPAPAAATPAPAEDAAPAASAETNPPREKEESDTSLSVERPLATLPEPPPIALPDPEPQDLKALDGLLARLTDSEAMVRERAVRELLEVKPRWMAAIHARLDRLADRANKVAMKETLQRIRDLKRKELREGGGSSDEGGKSGPADYLAWTVEHAKPDDESWRNLVHALALSRMLRHIDTVAAARSLVHVYVRYGEFLRVNTQLELEAMGDRSLAALIETRRHPAQKIAQWAERQLDLRGKAIASEALQTEDQTALADILRAFGRIRDPDSARVIISFAQSERAQLRNAAREAVVLLGEVATWQLRDAYESTVGKRTPREWSWQRIARELFTEYDRLRQAEEYELFERGLAAYKAGKLEEMVETYDRVLAYNPMFERREEMSAGYLDYARKVGEEDPARAISALRRAERIADRDDERRRLRSLRHTLEARRLLDSAIADQGLIHQALALDPENRLAEETLETAMAGGSPTLARTSRYWAALVIAGVSLFGAGGILWMGARRRRAHRSGSPAPQATLPESDDDSSDGNGASSPAEDEAPGAEHEARSSDDDESHDHDDDLSETVDDDATESDEGSDAGESHDDDATEEPVEDGNAPEDDTRDSSPAVESPAQEQRPAESAEPEPAQPESAEPEPAQPESAEPELIDDESGDPDAGSRR